MDSKTLKNTLIAKEIGAELFSYTRSKFINNVDTFYYSVKCTNDWENDLYVLAFLNTLAGIRKVADESYTEQPYLDTGLVVRPFMGFRMYKYNLSKKDCFDIFVAEKVPNEKTSTIFVQVRSEFLWLNGVEKAIEQSLEVVKSILEKNGIQIHEVIENRIDFAYHTNYIQDMLNFFKTTNLSEMQSSNFKRWSVEGCFFDNNSYSDYVTLGRKKSNNVFIRIYNKSKEVIEMGYKQFFVYIWHEKGLISDFDKYIFEKCFEDGKNSWNYKETARCLFYLEYGQAAEHKQAIKNLLANPASSASDFKALADMLVPDLTDIVNIEFQTKRKFYADFVFPKIELSQAKPFQRLELILKMLPSVRDFLTFDTIRFVRYKGKYKTMRRDLRPTADWWYRLTTSASVDDIHYDLAKEYQVRFDTARYRMRTYKNFATLQSYLSLDEEDISTSFEDDILDFLNHMNDNDMEKYLSIREVKHKEVKGKFRG